MSGVSDKIQKEMDDALNSLVQSGYMDRLQVCLDEPEDKPRQYSAGELRRKKRKKVIRSKTK